MKATSSQTYWPKLKSLDYADLVNTDVFPTGMGLRFYEQGGKPMCRLFHFGSGVPIIGRDDFPVTLEAGSLSFGDFSYTVDPGTLALTLRLRDAKPILPDRDGDLKFMIRAAGKE